MHSIALLKAFLSILSVVSAGPIDRRAGYSVKDSHSLPKRWSRTGPAPAAQMVKLHIGLKQDRFAELERALYEGELHTPPCPPIDLLTPSSPVSDPSHPRYSQHLSKEDVDELISPSQHTLNLVHAWLSGHGINTDHLEYSPSRDWMTVSMPVSLVETLLDTEYSIFQHEDGHKAVRTLEWSLPRELHEHITTIQPTNSFFGFETREASDLLSTLLAPESHATALETRDALATSSVPAACKLTWDNAGAPIPITNLECVRRFMGTYSYVPKATNKNKLATVNYAGETVRRNDTGLFFKTYRPEAVGAEKTFKITSVNGGKDYQGPVADSDINAIGLDGTSEGEFAYGIAWPTPFYAYNVGGEGPNDDFLSDEVNEPFLELTQHLLKQKTLPQVITQSYTNSERTFPQSYATTVCNQYAQLGARGVSLIVSSGNFGVGRGDCINPYDQAVEFDVQFPASCPYVTAVGSTKGFAPEVAADEPTDGMGSAPFASGAGYSNYFARPAYQKAVVDPYTARVSKYWDSWTFNRTGRAYPDIAAQGQNIVCNYDNGASRLDSNGVSAQIAGAAFSLVNDALIAAGKKPLGFLNPFIYAKGNTVFNDITSGRSKGCTGNGFPTATGWDAVTGFGTINFSKLLNAALAYQS